VVRAPLEATHLLPVALEPALRLQRRGPDVSLQDDPVAAPRRQLVGVPRQCTWRAKNTFTTVTACRNECYKHEGRWFDRSSDRTVHQGTVSRPMMITKSRVVGGMGDSLTHSGRVPLQHGELLPGRGVPDLDVALVGAHRHQVTL